MSVKKNIEFHRGETWMIFFKCHDANNVPIDLTGASVLFRISQGEANHLINKSVGDGIAITDALGGAGIVSVTPADQDTAGIGEKKDYNYELKVIKSGVVSVQNYGVLKVLASLFYP